MTKTTGMLKEMVAKKKEKIALVKQALPVEEIKSKIPLLCAPRPFLKAIDRKSEISLIAEIKKASPSCGVIREDFNHINIARIYQEANVQALSVLTEEDFFLGSLSFINEIKSVVDLPVLRKDFILEPYQIYESRVFGADAVLLIADLLSKDALAELMGLAGELGIDYLIEVHTEKELKKVLSLKVPFVGINNRDLRTLEVDFKTTEKLFPLIPKDIAVVVESGIKNYQDILFLKILKAKAVLIGQSFMEAPDIKTKVEDIMGW